MSPEIRAPLVNNSVPKWLPEPTPGANAPRIESAEADFTLRKPAMKYGGK